MNIFALEKFDDNGKRCTFYTVRWEEDDTSEMDKFIAKFENDIHLQTSLQEFGRFLYRNIGNEKGALARYFKFENNAHALPPSGIHLVGENAMSFVNFTLRLYCLRISDGLVVLFNGGEKTSESAQDGKTSMTFIEANQFSKRIFEPINDHEIYITSNQREFRNYDGSEEILL